MPHDALQPSPAPHQERQAEQELEEGARFRVLIADDQPEHLEMIARAIERSKHAHLIELIRASDGPEALSHVSLGIDVAFLDIRMPGCSGLEVVAKIRDDPALADLPVVIVSSSSDPRDLENARVLGVTHYVEKGRFAPFCDRIQGVLAALLHGKPL